MIIKLVALIRFWLNTLPPSPFVGGNLSPRQITKGLTFEYEKHCCLQFGEYAQVHEAHDNMIQEWATGELALRPTGKAQGV